MYAVLSMNDEKYQPLADYTWVANKAEYCKLHGYLAVNQTDNFRYTGKTIGFEKIALALDVFNNHPKLIATVLPSLIGSADLAARKVHSG